MGKPFKTELQSIYKTVEWASTVDISKLQKDLISSMNSPMVIVGSGGSLSACYFVSKLQQQRGYIAKAVTPLELFYSKNILRRCTVLFISSSGKNTDILTGFKTTVSEHPLKTIVITLTKGTPLATLSAKTNSAFIHEFDNPNGKDGFLATNSLIAFFIILNRVYRDEVDNYKLLELDKNFQTNLQQFISKLRKDFTFKVLYADWSMPVAFDIESKFSEAALGNVLLSDYRNFGHGRHHWLDKRGSSTAIIALISPNDKELAEKTLALVPANIIVFRLETQLEGSLSSIDLLIKSFYLASLMGDLQGIDPGKPGVPDFGSKLYNLNYSKLLSSDKDTWKIMIQRKLGSQSVYNIPIEVETSYRNGLKNYLHKINNTKFKAIVFDYDGTLCNTANRFLGLDSAMGEVLNNLLNNNIIIGVATGRGKSVKKDLREVIEQKHWDSVIIGYYNGSQIGYLNDDSLPNNSVIHPTLVALQDKLLLKFEHLIQVELKSKQMTIEFKGNFSENIRSLITDYIHCANIQGLLCVESGHSVDVIIRPDVSKLNVLTFITELNSQNDYEILTIGDKGKYPGNDFELLSHAFSLSVDEVSSDLDTCWNLAPSGLASAEATLFYLNRIRIFNGYFKIKL